ncbi:MAG: gamma-butyrobetaine hydroxylase-like domain-containing protein [Pseudomonadota bacterium]
MTTRHWPTELRVPKDRAALLVRYGDGTTHRLSAEYLRVFTPSAERLGHGGTRTLIGGKQGVLIDQLSQVGRYAVRIGFDDGHHTGIYPLTSLWPLHEEFEASWAQYLAELAGQGLSRTVAGEARMPR